ncbi:Hypothetical predicted protein, partial [Cloeon dipterum]
MTRMQASLKVLLNLVQEVHPVLLELQAHLVALEPPELQVNQEQLVLLAHLDLAEVEAQVEVEDTQDHKVLLALLDDLELQAHLGLLDALAQEDPQDKEVTLELQANPAPQAHPEPLAQEVELAVEAQVEVENTQDLKEHLEHPELQVPLDVLDHQELLVHQEPQVQEDPVDTVVEQVAAEEAAVVDILAHRVPQAAQANLVLVDQEDTAAQEAEREALAVEVAVAIQDHPAHLELLEQQELLADLVLQALLEHQARPVLQVVVATEAAPVVQDLVVKVDMEGKVAIQDLREAVDLQ